ncbi:hypothetical protein [Parvularcula sp. IMCC14364]|uniref:hypothetical protein n=1 Tax=Parvularcula sp. IMCC14364 TaxID=3067902 RepID=UPI00274104B4|nr:hypothetical protein [Parvularcula sp. IMCC14364]
MFRIFLPLAFAASLLFAPFYSYTVNDEYAGELTSELTASKMFIEDPVNCARNMEFNPTVEGCGPNENRGLLGWAFYGAAASSVAAGLLGVIGLLPFIGRLTSVITTGAGGISTGAVGWFMVDLLQSGNFAQMAWGGWVAGVLALLTLVAGFNGMSGDRD